MDPEVPPEGQASSDDRLEALGKRLFWRILLSVFVVLSLLIFLSLLESDWLRDDIGVLRIPVVIGLSLTFAGLAAFIGVIAVCTPIAIVTGILLQAVGRRRAADAWWALCRGASEDIEKIFRYSD